MLSFAFTATTFGQKEIVVWSKAKGAKNVERKDNGKVSQTKSFTGSDEELGALVAWSRAHQKTGRKPKTGSLIDTSTGEIVWADEAKAKTPNAPGTKSFDKGYLPPNARTRKQEQLDNFEIQKFKAKARKPRTN
jgi:hypothetical protein